MRRSPSHSPRRRSRRSAGWDHADGRVGRAAVTDLQRPRRARLGGAGGCDVRDFDVYGADGGRRRRLPPRQQVPTDDTVGGPVGPGRPRRPRDGDDSGDAGESIVVTVGFTGTTGATTSKTVPPAPAVAGERVGGGGGGGASGVRVGGGGGGSVRRPAGGGGGRDGLVAGGGGGGGAAGPHGPCGTPTAARGAVATRAPRVTTALPAPDDNQAQGLGGGGGTAPGRRRGRRSGRVDGTPGDPIGSPATAGEAGPGGDGADRWRRRWWRRRRLVRWRRRRGRLRHLRCRWRRRFEPRPGGRDLHDRRRCRQRRRRQDHRELDARRHVVPSRPRRSAPTPPSPADPLQQRFWRHFSPPWESGK